MSDLDLPEDFEPQEGEPHPSHAAPITGALQGNRGRLHARVAVLKYVITPLIQALGEQRIANKGAPPLRAKEEVAKISAMVESAMALSEQTLLNLASGDKDPVDDTIRWMVVQAATHTIATRFRGQGQIMPQEEAAALAEAVFGVESKFHSMKVSQGESFSNTVGMFRAKMLEALVPVVNAIAQYSFGRAEHVLLAQISERLLKTADQVTRSLAPAGCTPRDWRLLCWGVLQAAGYLYSDCHFTEADRLLYMDKDERDSYFREHDQMPPLTFVWQAFDQRMAMLAALITYIEIPASAKLDEQNMEY